MYVSFAFTVCCQIKSVIAKEAKHNSMTRMSLDLSVLLMASPVSLATQEKPKLTFSPNDNVIDVSSRFLYVYLCHLYGFPSGQCSADDC